MHFRQSGWGTYLSRGAVELLQAIFQSLHFHAEVLPLEGQQVPVQLDLLQEGLGCSVVVSPVIDQVVFRDFVDADMDVSHKLTHRVLHLWLGMWGKREKISFSFECKTTPPCQRCQCIHFWSSFHFLPNMTPRMTLHHPVEANYFFHDSRRLDLQKKNGLCIKLH